MAAAVQASTNDGSYKWDKWLDDFRYKEGDSTESVRSALLVVATVILAATFTAGVTPPGGVWQETDSTPLHNHRAGQAVLASYGDVFTAFLCFNTAAFSSANIVIGFLVANFPFSLEIWLALFCMSVTYGISIGSLSSASTTIRLVYVSLFAPYIIPAYKSAAAKLRK